MPEHDEEFPTFIFVYNKAANLEKIIKSVKSSKENSARVILATAVEQAHIIIFQMNRAAYLQVCVYVASYATTVPLVRFIIPCGYPYMLYIYVYT